VPAQRSTTHTSVHAARKPRPGCAKVPFYQLCALNVAQAKITKAEVAQAQAPQARPALPCPFAPGCPG